MYVTTDEELKDLCERLTSCDMLALDTEFVRETTYFHRVGLIQVSGNGVCAVIDPILISNIEPFLDLIKKPDVLKVFHAARQDLEILFRLCGDVVRPIFDTQIAASVVGWGSQISFAKIVEKVTGKKIYKSETYTDWCRRPLSKNQIDYALDDVRYLVPVYEKLVRVLTKLERYDWVRAEFKFLEEPKFFKGLEPQKHYLKIKNTRHLNPRDLGVLNELAVWRESEARKRDCLPKHIMRDEPLVEVARQKPKDIAGLLIIRGLHQREANKSIQQILDAIQKGLDLPEGQLPVIPKPDGYSARRGVEELLAAYIQIRAEELKIEPNILADRKTIHSFVKSYDQDENLEDHSLFKGWRKESIGDILYSILNGEKGVTINKKGKVTLFTAHE